MYILNLSFDAKFLILSLISNAEKGKIIFRKREKGENASGREVQKFLLVLGGEKCRDA